MRRFLAEDQGQDLIEYALLASIIGIAGLTLFPVISTKIDLAFRGWGVNVNDKWVPLDPVP